MTLLAYIPSPHTGTIDVGPLKIHMYGKDVKPGRKVGHVNTYGDDLDDVLERARHAAGYLRGTITE